MAKKKKKTKSKTKKHKAKVGGAVAGGALLGNLFGDVAGKVVTRLVADAVQDHVLKPKKRSRSAHADDANGKPAHGHADDDVAAKLLTALADGGCKPVPDLLEASGVGLSEMLRALETLRDFRLINFVGAPGEETVEVTRSGAHTVTVLRKHGIKQQATHLLGED